ncbi:hypothetical protein GCM10007079_15780 [Nocardiopsis terrae]|uniref:DUF4190 domain-containing protein n=1 Tax=Nocardiopsis terrae TaxID=372655 RepID=A0ABR9HB00_9ACTN|nr:hypothetical protein [Nocardiopsis terrae]MBE1456219.1 hypothetical protein [Nocardiopsis terrae]GHC78112.1 hypothetical protein GCM10007079_15780 [Nocardiopsis terrae]
MSEYWQNGPPSQPSGPPYGPPHDPSYGYEGSVGGYTVPGGHGTGGYSGYGAPAGHGGPPPGPAPYPAYPHGAPPPSRTSAVVALVVSIILAVACLNPFAIGGLAFAAVSLDETRDHDRAARHARYAWYTTGTGSVLMVLFFVLLVAWLIGLS